MVLAELNFIGFSLLFKGHVLLNESKSEVTSIDKNESCSFPYIPLSNTNRDDDFYCTFSVLQPWLSGLHNICFD